MTYEEIALSAFKASKWTEAIAAARQTDLSNAEVLAWMGYCYRYGNGVARDLVQAFTWFKKSAEGGYSWSMGELGHCYYFGRGVAKNYSSALTWYRKGAEAGDAASQTGMGHLYEFGRGVERSAAKAFQWYKKAAENGDIEGMEELGECYEMGFGVDENLAEAFKWYSKAAERGNSDAQYHVGAMCEFGRGTQKDIAKAFAWYKKSAEKGDARSQNRLGRCYEFGKGTEKNLAEAFKWYLKSAESGFPPGQFNVGDMYEYGKGTEKDISKAFYWYKKAAENGDSAGQNRLGLCYELAKGTTKNFVEAVKWYVKSAENGNANGQFNAGDMYENGKGVEKDYAKALSWYKKAAEHGHPGAMIALGRFYENGYGVKKDLVEAKKWYQKAKDAGDDDADDFLKSLEEKMKPAPGTKVTQTSDGDKEASVEDVLKELDALTGLKPVKDEVRKLIDFVKVQNLKAKKGFKTTAPSNHIVFTGNPGTGKTTVARIISKVFKALGILKTDKLVETDRSGLVAKYIGQTAEKTNAIIDSALDGVLFIDEAYSLAQGGENDYGKEAVDALLKRMEDDRDRLVVIVAGYTKEMKKFLKMNPGLQSRFTRFVDFPDYSADELTSIFKAIAAKSEYMLDEDVLPAVRQRMEYELSKRLETFANARFVRTYFEQTLEKQASRVGQMASPNEADLQRLTAADIPGLSALDGGGESVDDILKELDELVGIEPVKREIRKLVSYFKLQNKRKAAGLPVAPASYHCVFSGSPGTGKTTVARYMARAYKALGVTKTANLVEADRSKLVAEYIGQTAVKTNDIINEALNGVLFIDEAYTLANGGEKDFGHEAVDTLLTRMEDDRDRLVVIIAGYTDEMHKFIDMNPGLQSRFTRYIDFPDYSAEELAEIFARMAKKELYRFGDDVMRVVQSEMKELVANKTKSFGNARVARTFYEQAKERQAMRLVKIADPTKEQLTELRVSDVSDEAANEEGTNPYDIIREVADLESAKGLFAADMLNNRSVVKHCAYQVGELLVNDLLEDKGLAGQYPIIIRADISAALHIGIGAAAEYRLHPAELKAEMVYNMMMRAGGLCKVGEIGVGKLGTFATEEVCKRLSKLVGAFQTLAAEVAKRDGQYYAANRMPKDQADAFGRLLHREAYAAFLTGFAIGTYLQKEGTQEVVKNGISVQIDYTPHLNLALAQNSHPLISNLRIRNRTRGKLKNCECRISCPERFLLEYSHDLGDIWDGKEADTGAIPIRFNVEALRRVASVQTGYLRVEILSDGKSIIRHDYRIEAVAPDHSHDILSQPDMLAAYVIPHCGVVRQMQSDAATLLGQGTGNPSLDGYQGDRERVAFICRAIFEAIRRKYIRYAECPANFGLPGQKIRLPNEIMQYKLATCLDSTLLFAALAEACNLNPVVVLIEGHAFVGVFLENCHLPQVAVDKSIVLKKYCHDNAMIMIETTAVCHSDVPFDAAVNQGMKRLFTLDEDDFEWAIDVSLARLNGVKQLSLGDDAVIKNQPPQTHVQTAEPQPVKPTPPPLVLASDPVQTSLFDTTSKAPAQTRAPVATQIPVAQPANASGDRLTEAKLSAMKKPTALMFDGAKVANVGTWKDLFQKLIEKLNELYPAKFDTLAGDSQFGKYFMRLEPGKKTPRDFFKIKLGSDGSVRAKEQANKIYLWRQDYYFRKLLSKLGVDAARIEVI